MFFFWSLNFVLLGALSSLLAPFCPGFFFGRLLHLVLLLMLLSVSCPLVVVVDAAVVFVVFRTLFGSFLSFPLFVSVVDCLLGHASTSLEVI